MKNFKDKRGFTLVEVLVVVSIIGILATISTPRIVQNIDKAKVTRIVTKYNAFKKATINNMNSGEIKLDNKLIETITNEVQTVPEKTPIGGEYLLTHFKDEKVKYLEDIDDSELKDITISWQAALGIVDLDNTISSTDKKFKQLVKTLGNNNVVAKNNGLYIKIVD